MGKIIAAEDPKNQNIHTVQYSAPVARLTLPKNTRISLSDPQIQCFVKILLILILILIIFA